jgi:hypothetical protein
MRAGGWSPLRIEWDRAEGVRAAQGEEAFAVAWAEGQGLPLDEAIALALEGTGTVLQVHQQPLQTIPQPSH